MVGGILYARSRKQAGQSDLCCLKRFVVLLHPHHHPPLPPPLKETLLSVEAEMGADDQWSCVLNEMSTVIGCRLVLQTSEPVCSAAF